MVTVIRDTKLPNYKMATYPVCSKLNLHAWHCYVHDYHDKRLIQYLTFGFPLSIQDDSNLHKTEITNHYSAVRFPGAVSQYLNTEIQMGAILRPFQEVQYDHFHCSPLLTRPKDVDKRRVILDLSYKFYDTSFTLRFPIVDDILDNIRHNKSFASKI